MTEVNGTVYVGDKPANIDKIKLLGVYNTSRGTDSCGISINNNGGSETHNNIPPYYVLAYIMKCY